MDIETQVNSLGGEDGKNQKKIIEISEKSVLQ
jgi:hypothetical protein